MLYLSIEEILRLHHEIIKDFGRSHGVRERGRLLSVVEAPAQQVFGQDKYVSVFQKAAVYMRNIIADHPFVDGNKRTGITTGVIFLKRNGYGLNATPKELEDFAVRVAVKHLCVDEIAGWLEQHGQQQKT